MYPTSVPKLVFFGDSVCVGQFVSPHLTWVTRVAAALGDGVAVMNPSVNGNTTRQALERMPYDVQAHKPDILVIQFGINDCNVWDSDWGLPRVSLAAFKANLAEIVDRGRRFGAREVFLHTNHGCAKNERHTTATRTYNEAIRSVAAASGATLTDLERLTEHVPSPDLLLPDGVHLSPLGHDLYFRSVLPRIESAL